MPFPVLPLPLAFSLPNMLGVPDVIGRVIPPMGTAVISTTLASLYDAWSLQDQKKQWGFFQTHLYETKTPTFTADQLNKERPYDPKKGLKTYEKRTEPVFTSSSVFSIDLEEKYQVSSAPQEDGAFTSYNKTKSQTTGKVRLVCDGYQTGASLPFEALGKARAIWDKSARPIEIKKAFMNKLSDLVSNTELYTLIMPEKTWDRVNIVGYQISRSANQLSSILFVDVQFVEVRSVKVATLKSTRKPEGAPKIDNGLTSLQDTDLVLGGLY